MAFHADFWVVVGTVAPVIALASIVSASDSVAITTKWPKSPDRLKRREKINEKAPIFWPYLLSSLNLSLQSFLLLTSLFSLATTKNFLPPSLVALADCAGLEFLFMVGVASAHMRRRYERGQAKDETRPKV